MTIDRISLDTGLSPGRPPAYGEVLDGDPLLALRSETTVGCWRTIDPVLATWRADQTPFEPYPAGSQGAEGWPTERTLEPRAIEAPTLAETDSLNALTHGCAASILTMCRITMPSTCRCDQRAILPKNVPSSGRSKGWSHRPAW